MTVEPLSQLTIRIVPASTSRRKPATMKGRSTSTATGTATTRIHWGIGTSPRKCGVHTPQRAVNPSPNRRTTPYSGSVGCPRPPRGGGRLSEPECRRRVLRTQRSEHLYDLAIDFCRDETLAVRIEATGRAHFIQDAAFERKRGSRSEPQQEVPDGADDAALEQDAAAHCCGEDQRLRQGTTEQQSGRSEADEHTEHEPRGCETPQPGSRRCPRAASVVRLPAPRDRLSVRGARAASQLGSYVTMPMAAESRDRHRH